MDLQVQEIENEKLEKQKTDLQKQFESISEKVVLLEKHERQYNNNILIYCIDDSDQDENIYAVTRHLFTQDLEIDHRKENFIPIANAHRLPTRSKGPKPIIVRFLHFRINNWLCLELAGKHIRILDDLPVSMKEERFLLSHVVYTICKNEKLQTRIRDDGAHMILETRKNISDK
jgi:hypothetical protein